MAVRFTHWALHVQDMESAVRFYEEFCGLKVVREHGDGSNEHAVWMAEEGREQDLVLVLLLGGEGNQQAEGDLSHFGFSLDSKEEVDEVAARGRAAGCLFREPRQLPFPVGYLCMLKDPDGYIIEFSYGQPLGPAAP